MELAFIGASKIFLSTRSRSVAGINQNKKQSLDSSIVDLFSITDILLHFLKKYLSKIQSNKIMFHWTILEYSI